MKHVDLHLDNNVVEEWRDHYVDYKRLRKLCYALYPNVHEQVSQRTRSPFSLQSQFKKLQKTVVPRRPSFETMPIEELVYTHRPIESKHHHHKSTAAAADGGTDSSPTADLESKQQQQSQQHKSLEDARLHTTASEPALPALHTSGFALSIPKHSDADSSSSSVHHDSVAGPSDILKRLFSVLGVPQDDNVVGRHTAKELALLDDNDKLTLFIDELKHQIKKCNHFFLHVEKELNDSLAAVKAQAQNLDIFAESPQMLATVRDSLELLYRRWHMLYNFATLNNLAFDSLVDFFDDHAIVSQQYDWQSLRFHSKVAGLTKPPISVTTTTTTTTASPTVDNDNNTLTSGGGGRNPASLELERLNTGLSDTSEAPPESAFSFNIAIKIDAAASAKPRSPVSSSPPPPNTAPAATATTADTALAAPTSQLTHRHSKHSNVGGGGLDKPLIPPESLNSSTNINAKLPPLPVLGSAHPTPGSSPSDVATLTTKLQANAAQTKMPKFAANCRFAFNELIRETSIRNTTHIPEVIKGIVSLYAQKFTGGDNGKAKSDLTTGMSDADLSLEIEYLKLGVKLGAVLVMLIWNILSFVNFDNSSQAGAYIPVFRGFGLIIVFMWVWGACVYVWTTYRVNWVFIFEVNPLDCLTYMQIWDEAAVVSIMYLVITDLFFLHDQRGWAALPLPPLVYPFTLLIFYLLKLLWPYRPFSHWATRRVLLGSLMNVCIAPFGRLLFRDMYTADVLTSITRVLTDFYYDFCFYFSGIWLNLTPETINSSACVNGQDVVVPIIIALPLFWRFNQCFRLFWNTRQPFPHLANAGKYFLAYLVVLMGGLHPKFATVGDSWNGYRVFWLVCFVGSTLYALTWDLVMDWGLFREPFKSPQPFLRKQLMYPLYYYYIGAVLNTLMRFLWTLNLVPLDLSILGGATSDYYRAVISPIFMVLEVIRRGIWSIFRVECAHVGHWDEFKKLDFVPVPLNVKPVMVVKQEWKKIFFEFSTMLILVVVTAALVNTN